MSHDGNDYAYYEGEWEEWYGKGQPRLGGQTRSPMLQILSVVIVVIGLLFWLVSQNDIATVAEAAPAPHLQPTAVPTLMATVAPTAVAALPPDPGSIIVPYDEFVITQGLHGASYGQMAVDIAAGKGATIKSPIDGEVTDRSIDEWGNTILVIENERYQITFFHGDYFADVGDRLRQGEPLGTEGNNGYTMDMNGNLCYNRDCGYHSHINIFDKILQTNVDPFLVMEGLR